MSPRLKKKKAGSLGKSADKKIILKEAKMKTQLFEIEDFKSLTEIRKVENTTFKIDSISIDLILKITEDSSRFIDNAVIFFMDIKKAAISRKIKLSSFKTDKKNWTVKFKASGTVDNINNLLIDLNTDNIKFITDKKFAN